MIPVRENWLYQKINCAKCGQSLHIIDAYVRDYLSANFDLICDNCSAQHLWYSKFVEIIRTKTSLISYLEQLKSDTANPNRISYFENLLLSLEYTVDIKYATRQPHTVKRVRRNTDMTWFQKLLDRNL